MARVELRNVTKRYGGTRALKDLSLTVEDGEFFVLLGRTGAGKTTTLRVIAGLEKPDEGSVLIDGKDVAGWTAAERDVALVLQQYSLYPRLTVRGNLEFPLKPKVRGMSPDQIADRVEKAAQTLQITHLLDRSVSGLAAGDRQRVALGRAIVRRAKAFLMDEPLGALDALTREKMQGLVLKLWKETGKTIILITHSVEEALLLGERLLVMAPRPGRIHKEYRLPFAEMGVGRDLRLVKKEREFAERREEILGMIWDMEEEIMGRQEEPA